MLVRLSSIVLCFCLLWIVYSGVADNDDKNYIYDVIPDYRWYYYKMPTGSAVRQTLHIEDTAPNKAQTLDMIKVRRQTNDKGEPKYHIKAGTVEAVPDWVVLVERSAIEVGN